LYEEGKIDESIQSERRALEIKEGAFGKDSPKLGSTLNELANGYLYEHDYASAEATYRRAADIYERGLGADHPRVGAVLGNLANAIRHQHRLAEAEALFRKSIAIRSASLGPTNPNLCNAFTGLSQIALEREQWAEAEAQAQGCIRAYEKSGAKPDNPAFAEPLDDLANAQLGAGHYATAIATYTRALGLLDPTSGDPLERAAIHLGLGKALCKAGDQDKGLAELAAAADLARTQGDRGTELARAITAARPPHP
jgi:hypothetical protein